MYARTARIKASSRRGTVMILVVGVLAMLFIIGSTLLIVGRFERQTVQTSASAKNMEAVSQGILEPVIVALREDLLGPNGKAYFRDTWLTAIDPVPADDYGDYPGVVLDAAGKPVIPPSPRNGDLLLSSLEPYKPGPCCWDLFAASWFRDAIDPRRPTSLPPGTIAIGFVDSDPNWGGIVADADGDGIRDAVKLPNVGFSDSFGGTFSMGLRVIPHNGMVWLNRMTHPTLLAQGIHLSDRSVMTMDELRTAIGNLGLGPADENRLRRRLMLAPLLPTPDPGQNYFDVAQPLVQLLPITTGYSDPGRNADSWTKTGANDGPVNQWLMFQPGQEAEWEKLIQPRYEGSSYVAMTDSRYRAPLDTYDRRHLITRDSSDDALRPQRDERRLQAFPLVAPFTGHFENIISPVNASLSLAYGVMDYTAGGGTIDHVFNTDGLRTQFSLRDVLEPVYVIDHWEGHASYRRAMQLTAYFLAMIQHTTVPGSDVLAIADPLKTQQLAAQLRTAMQLAVNAIDFADADQIPTYFEFDNGAGLAAKVVGVEKQPYITEAYAKVVRKPVPDGTDFKWPDSAAPEYRSNESVYAVELYNPYATDLDLSDYDLVLVGGGSTIEVDLSLSGTITIPSHSYVVLANNDKDPSRTPGQTATEDLLSSGSPFVFSTIKMDAGQPVVLQRKAAKVYRLDSANPWGPPVLGVSDPVDVDTIRPASLGGADNDWAEGAAIPGGTPGADDRLVRDSSLQRHKEIAGQPPVHWHFTLSRQMLFPLPWCEHNDNPARLTTDKDRLAQHNLLGAVPYTQDVVLGPDALTGPAVPKTNQDIMLLESAGIRINHDTDGGTIIPGTPVGSPEPGAVFPMAFNRKEKPIAPFPVLVADRGVHPNTGGTMAFPTTGTLLLVTRYAHLPMQGVMTEDKPLSVAATDFVVKDFDGFGNPIALRSAVEQTLELDNGHLPVFDTVQKCLDGNNSRFNDLPWGQLAFEYFTALPMEELARDIDLDPGAGVNVGRLMDLDPAVYGEQYGAASVIGGPSNWLDWTKSRFLNYPVMMPVSQASSPLGPRVQGRIGISNAPWWVLDGLPVLPDAMPGTVNAIPSGTYSTSALAGLPVPEIEGQWLDPYDYRTNPDYFMAGAGFVRDLIDEKYAALVPPYTSVPPPPPGEMPSISPKLAQYMVSYRENREIGAIDARYPGRIGFATAGELCNVMRKARLDFDVLVGATNVQKPNLDDLRLAVNHPTNPTARPYSYLGYLQLVTPIVRMQDWMTVKNHVFTIYATIQSSGQPPVTVRTQVTVDRTRCLYNPNDLPERITETPPISYYNAVDD